MPVLGVPQLLAPKLSVVAALVATSIVGVDVTWTGFASLIVAAIVALAAVVAGVFTVRSNIKSYWREVAEERGSQVYELEQHLKERADELIKLQASHALEMLSFAEEQREIRHELKENLAATQHALTLEMAKHDLSAVLAKLDALHKRLDAIEAIKWEDPTL